MKWASHRRRRGRNRCVVDSSLPTRRVLRFEPLESRRLLDAAGFVINEVLVNPHGADSPHEYIEIRSTAGIAETIPAGTYLLGIESDTFTANPGDVQNIFDLSGLTTGSNGLLVLVQKGSTLAVSPSATRVANTESGVGWGNGATSSVRHTADGVMVDIENTSTTLMLISAAVAPTLATDIDSNNDGTSDGAAFASWIMLDSVGLLDGQDNDIGYGAINFRMGADGHSQGAVIDVSFNAGYVARKGNATGATADDWVAGYVAGAAPNWTLDAAKVSDPHYAGHALNHIGSANPNSVPTLAHSAGTFDEASTNTLTTTQLQAVDLEQSATAIRFTAESLPTHGTLLKNGTPMAVADKFTQADIDAGHISYTHDGSETTSDGFGFTLADGAGGSTSGTFSITIAPVNDLPTLVANLGLAIDEDLTATITTSLLQVVDADNSAEQLTFLLAAAPVHGTLAKNGVPLAASDSFTQHDVDLGLITYQHNGDVALADQFTFSVVDGSGGTIESTTFAIAITQFNLPPAIAANDASVSVAEGTTTTTGGTYSDPDFDAVVLTASVGAVNDNGDGTWSWSYATADGPEDSQTVTITIDDGLTTAQTTFTLEVLNAAPVIAVNAGEVAVAEGESATNAGTYVDVAADTVTLSASIGTVVDNGDGTWSWSFAPDNGPQDPQTVTITADDGLAQSQVTFTLMVANLAPSIAANAAEVSVNESETATNTGTFGDVATDTVTLTASVGMVIDNGDGTWSWSWLTTNGPEDSQTVTITADDGLAQTQVTFTLSVANVAPAIAADSGTVSAPEGSIATNTGTLSDVAADTVVLSASLGAVTNNGDGTWSWSYDTTAALDGSQLVTITADDGLAQTQIAFELHVINTDPEIEADSAAVAVDEGQAANNSGTLENFAAETLVLTASVGTITKGENGTWSWSYAAADGPEDSQTVTITADDGVGHAEATFTLTVSNVVPAIAALASEVAVDEGQVAANSGTFADVAADTVTLTASLGTVTDNGDGTWSWSFAPDDGRQDPQTVTITADDGLAQSQVTFTLTVANVPPSIATNAAEVSVSEGETATNTGTFADVAVDTVTLTASMGTVIDNGDGTWSWSYATSDGPQDSQIVSITADDGLATSQVSFTLVVTNVAPSIAANASEVSVVEGAIAANSGTFADVPSDSVTLTASVGTVINNGDGTWSWSWTTTSGPEDSQTVVITADDGSASSVATFSLVVVDTTPTILANSSSVAVSEGDIAANSGTLANFVSETLFLSASVGTIVNNGDGTWSWSFATTYGPEDSQTVTITADDGTSSAQVTFALDVVNTAPSVSANASEVSTVEGDTAMNSGTFADVATDAVTLSASVGAVIDNGDGTWSWSWTTSDGPEDSQIVAITADDGIATSQVTFTLTVTNAAPSITTNASEITVAEGETATNSGTFADVPADPVTLTASVGTVTDNGDGTWSWTWTTTNGPDDSQVVTITADDGLSTSKVTFTLDVANSAPSGSAAFSEVTVAEGEIAANAGTYSDVAGDVVTLTASIGNVIDHGDGTWSWSCDTTGFVDYSHVVTITADDGLAATPITFALEIVDATLEIEANAATVAVTEGQTATNSGTFENFASGILLLSASAGAVVNHGDGTWSWAFDTANGPEDSQTVTITADDGVAMAQATFALDVSNEAPMIGVSASEVNVAEGETATNAGTFGDVAADTVMLSASFGVVIDNGDGTWSWSWITSDGPEDSQFVTVTADDGLATAQVTFNLTVTNAAPSVAANSNEVIVTAGETAANSGTFGDVGADIIALTASIGTVTDNGDGTWSWSYATTSATADTGPVTITATDSDNLLSTVVFNLVVNSPVGGGSGAIDALQDSSDAESDSDFLAAIDGVFAALGGELA